MIEEGFEAVTLETHVRYRAPTRFDDQLRVWARITEPERLQGAVPLRVRDRAAERSGRRGRGRLDEPRDGGRDHARADRMPAWLADEIRAAEAG